MAYSTIYSLFNTAINCSHPSYHATLSVCLALYHVCQASTRVLFNGVICIKYG